MRKTIPDYKKEVKALKATLKLVRSNKDAMKKMYVDRNKEAQDLFDKNVELKQDVKDLEERVYQLRQVKDESVRKFRELEEESDVGIIILKNALGYCINGKTNVESC